MSRPVDSSRPRDILWYLLRAQWASGLLPLAFLTEVSPPMLAVAGASLLAGAVLDGRGSERRGWQRAATPLLAASAAAAAADIAIGSGDLLTSVSLLVLGVQSVKFLLPKTPRDGWQLCAISFLEFLAAAATTTEIQFAAFLLLFLGLSAGAMWALHAEEVSEGQGRPVPRPRPEFAVPLVLLSAAGGFLLTSVLFAVTPRIGIGQMMRRAGLPTGIAGFSDSISLREVTSVKVDRRVVARVEFPDGEPGASPLGLYLRGATYALFDGVKWKRGGAPLESVQRGGFLYVLSPQPRASLSTADVVLEPMGHSALFVYGEPATVEGSLGDLRTDGRGNYLLPPSQSATRYRIRFAPEGTPRAARRTDPGDAYLSLPPGVERIRALAERVTAGAGSDEERVERATGFFRSGFRYTLTEAAASLDEFLFENRAGYCEHYAASLTVLLRASGIPARVAAGYQGGEWSDVGRYLIVRQSDAHAWTEALVGGRWVTLDATPALGENSPFFSRTGRIGIYLDWARQRWNKYVVNYSLQMQAEAVSGGWSALRRARTGLREAYGRVRRLGLWLVPALGVAAFAAFLARKAGLVPGPLFSQGMGYGGAPLPGPYARLFRSLTAGGHRKSPGTPFGEMLLAAAENTDLLPSAGRFLTLYHRDRFGPLPLSREESAEAARLADALRRDLTRAVAR